MQVLFYSHISVVATAISGDGGYGGHDDGGYDGSNKGDGYDEVIVSQISLFLF
jgi:aromatic ring-opening dioxygenase LigB subunit